MNRKVVCGAVISVLTLAIVGCVAGAAPEPQMAYEAEAPAGAPVEAVADDAEYASTGRTSSTVVDATVERLIVRNASLDLVVADTEAALEEISDLADALNGYVVESNTYKYQEGLQAHVILRIPAEELDAALESIRGLATEVRRENISGQDVTEEYVDLQSRLRHLEAAEAKLMEFLEEAEDTEAALAVYERLEQIQADIEYVKGRMQFLEESAAMATVTLDITPDELAQPIQVGGWHPEGTLRDAFQALIRVLQFLVDAAIVIIVLIVPTLAAIALPFVGLFYLVRAIVRRRRAHKLNRP
jgi:hypothetical protein